MQFVIEIVIGYDGEHKVPVTCTQTELLTVEPEMDGRVPLNQAGYEAPQFPVLGGIVASRVPAEPINRYQPTGK